MTFNAPASEALANLSGESAQRYRTLFLSDLHIGARGCQAEALLDFLEHIHADAIYLVGDIIDLWRLKSGRPWPHGHGEVVKTLLRQTRKGVRLLYLAGNHDAFARAYVGRRFAGVEIVDRTTHVTADGRRFLVVHGDQFDVVVRRARWLALAGAWAHDVALRADAWLNLSLSAWAKRQVKTAVGVIGNFEATLVAEALRARCDGVICGHVHQAVIKKVQGVAYINCGDFVHSRSAVVEHFDGRLEILNWRRSA